MRSNSFRGNFGEYLHTEYYKNAKMSGPWFLKASAYLRGTDTQVITYDRREREKYFVQEKK